MPSQHSREEKQAPPDSGIRLRLTESGSALLSAGWMAQASEEATVLRQHLRPLHFHAAKPFRCGHHSEKMPRPPKAPARASGRELIALMEAEVSSELLIPDQTGASYKRITAGDLLGITPLFLDMLKHAARPSANQDAPPAGRQHLSAIIAQGLEQDIPLRILQLVVSELAESLHHIALHDGIKAYGAPPCDFMFMVMGSEGRFEQTLKTDQDNAIVFSGDEQTHQPYFLKLGAYVNEALHGFGFELCKGDVMARNPKWCRSLDSWKRYFSRWIRTPKPMAVMQSTIFFDFKCGYGNPEFRRALRQHLREMLAERAELFFFHLAGNAMDNTIPLGFFGGFKYPSEEGLDVKKAMLPAVNYARLYALRHHLHHPNTLRRLHELKEAGLLPAAEAEQLCETYIFMMDIRLRHQLACLQEGRAPGNTIIPEEYPKEMQARLKKALKEMKALQQHLRLEYSSGY